MNISVVGIIRSYLFRKQHPLSTKNVKILKKNCLIYYVDIKVRCIVIDFAFGGLWIHIRQVKLAIPTFTELSYVGLISHDTHQPKQQKRKGSPDRYSTIYEQTID